MPGPSDIRSGGDLPQVAAARAGQAARQLAAERDRLRDDEEEWASLIDDVTFEHAYAIDIEPGSPEYDAFALEVDRLLEEGAEVG